MIENPRKVASYESALLIKHEILDILFVGRIRSLSESGVSHGSKFFSIAQL